MNMEPIGRRARLVEALRATLLPELGVVVTEYVGEFEHRLIRSCELPKEEARRQMKPGQIPMQMEPRRVERSQVAALLAYADGGTTLLLQDEPLIWCWNGRCPKALRLSSTVDAPCWLRVSGPFVLLGTHHGMLLRRHEHAKDSDDSYECQPAQYPVQQPTKKPAPCMLAALDEHRALLWQGLRASVHDWRQGKREEFEVAMEASAVFALDTSTALVQAKGLMWTFEFASQRWRMLAGGFADFSHCSYAHGKLCAWHHASLTFWKPHKPRPDCWQVHWAGGMWSVHWADWPWSERLRLAREQVDMCAEVLVDITHAQAMASGELFLAFTLRNWLAERPEASERFCHEASGFAVLDEQLNVRCCKASAHIVACALTPDGHVHVLTRDALHVLD